MNLEDRNVACVLTHLFYLWASLLKYVLVPLIFPKIHGLTMVHGPQISLLLLAPVLAAKIILLISKKIKSKGYTKINKLYENQTFHGSVWIFSG